MSHISKVELQINDLDCLRVAVEDLGLEWREGQKVHKWFGRFVDGLSYADGLDRSQYGKCDHAIRVKDNVRAYEIGVIKSADQKSYELVYDNYMGGFGLEEIAGVGLEKLRQGYAVNVAKKAAKHLEKQGFRLTQTRTATGSVLLQYQKA